MSRIDWDDLIRSLVLVHIGQQLGAEGRLAKIVYDCTEFLFAILR